MFFFFFQSYDHLFKVNDKSVGGSFYLQSKVSNSYFMPHELLEDIIYLHCSHKNLNVL